MLMNSTTRVVPVRCKKLRLYPNNIRAGVLCSSQACLNLNLNLNLLLMDACHHTFTEVNELYSEIVQKEINNNK